jgi:hypothetical protein
MEANARNETKTVYFKKGEPIEVRAEAIVFLESLRKNTKETIKAIEIPSVEVLRIVVDLCFNMAYFDYQCRQLIGARLLPSFIHDGKDEPPFKEYFSDAASDDSNGELFEVWCRLLACALDASYREERFRNWILKEKKNDYLWKQYSPDLLQLPTAEAMQSDPQLRARADAMCLCLRHLWVSNSDLITPEDLKRVKGTLCSYIKKALEVPDDEGEEQAEIQTWPFGSEAKLVRLLAQTASDVYTCILECEICRACSVYCNHHQAPPQTDEERKSRGCKCKNVSFSLDLYETDVKPLLTVPSNSQDRGSWLQRLAQGRDPAGNVIALRLVHAVVKIVTSSKEMKDAKVGHMERRQDVQKVCLLDKTFLTEAIISGARGTGRVARSRAWNTANRRQAQQSLSRPPGQPTLF